MKDNLLLMYLSELGHGKWPQFRQALDYLAEDEDALYRSVKARQLSALGHMEFAFEEDLRWSVCEPTIAWLAQVDQLTGVLCGQRSPKLLDTLSKWCDELDCELAFASQEEGPDVVSVLVPSSDVGELLAQKVGLKSQADAASRLVEILPRVSAYLALCPTVAAPRGYKTEKYDAGHLRWLEIDEDVSPGFYRYTHYQREYRLKIDDTILKTPPYIGIFAWLQHENRVVFTYNSDEEILIGPASAILPPLFSRAAVLCSGSLPKFKQYQHVYTHVPDPVARHLLYKLHQEKTA